MTPKDMSNKFGPFPAIESLLGAAETGKGFAHRKALQRGNEMLERGAANPVSAASLATEACGEGDLLPEGMTDWSIAFSGSDSFLRCLL